MSRVSPTSRLQHLQETTKRKELWPLHDTELWLETGRVLEGVLIKPLVAVVDPTNEELHSAVTCNKTMTAK